MAVAAAGNGENVEVGFIPTNSAVVSLAGTTAGFLDGDVGIELPHERAFVKVGLSPIKSYVTARNISITCTCKEVLLANLQYAWDTDAASGSVLTLDEDVGSTFALLVTVDPPNDDGTNDTRVLSVPKAISSGPGAYSMPLAGSGESNSSVSLSFMGIADTASKNLLGTLTDTYGA